MKVIFDRSAFHDHFDLIEGSRLLELAGAGNILVYHTAVFLDETLRMASSTRPGRKDELKRQWPFLKAICNGGWFRPLLFGQPPLLKSVCDEELDGGEKYSSWPLIPASHRGAVEARVTKFLEGTRPLSELDNAQPTYDQNEQIKKRNKKLRFELRSKHTLRKGETFLEYYQSLVVEAASLFIHRAPVFDQLQLKLAALDQPKVKFDAWKRDPKKFPHFTAFLGFFIYGLYGAELNQNLSLDPNWLPDAEQLCFLVDVDAIVSSERGFMRRAFEALWQPSQKSIFTPEEFVAHLSQERG
jgi:hypothetical protein